MDSLSVGISIPRRFWAKDQATWVTDCQLWDAPVIPGPIAGNGDHDPLETVITMLWNE
jgi:hypothetical protein